jgi:7-cyano-7-deazaguanine synthase
MKVIVLLSGGMDSTCALYKAYNDYESVEAISFDYGSKHNQKEIPYAKYHCDKLGIKHVIVNLEFINQLFKSDLLKSGGDIPEGHYEQENMKSTVVPFRNGILLAIACGYAESVEAGKIIIASHGGDHAIYPDCRSEFNQAMNEAMKLGTYKNVQLEAPFEKFKKEDVAKLGSTLGVDFSQTWSCYKGRELHCGKCGTCVERIEAFKLAGLEDKTKYED